VQIRTNTKLICDIFFLIKFFFFDTNGKSIAKREPVQSYVIFEEWVPHKFSSQAPYPHSPAIMAMQGPVT
jgi:hypothetical protein